MNKGNNFNIEEAFNIACQNQKKNNFTKAKEIYSKIIKLQPKFIEAHNNLGLIFRAEGKVSDAIKCYEKILEIDPNLINANINLGIIFQKIGNNKKAINFYNKVIEVNPNFIMAQYNLGLVFSQLGENEKAIRCYKKVIEVDPNIIDAHNNLGLLYTDLGKYREAINCYIEALKYNNNHTKVKKNLINALTYYRPNKINPIIDIDNLLKNIFNEYKNKFQNQNLENFFRKSFKIIKKIQIDFNELEYFESQIFRRNSYNLNCSRHHQVFNKHNIIPKFCFKCFKIQIEPRNVIDLVKLFIIFDSFKFPNNNWRKCMIELRPEITGTYKGLIYCSSISEAEKISNKIHPILQKNLKYKISIKRGCSEFYKSFPNYKETNQRDSNFMNFDEKWTEIEKSFDKKYQKNYKKLRENLSGFSLSDFLIINHWLNYAKLINDTSYKNLSDDFFYSKFIIEKMSDQIAFRKKEFSC